MKIHTYRIIELIGLIFLLAEISCDCQGCKGDGHFTVKATVYYINETADSILLVQGCYTDIAPNDSLVFLIDEAIGNIPNVDDFPIGAFTIICPMGYKEGDKFLCERGIEDISNYENRKEVEDLVFEFTFRFTEERKAVAEECL